MVSIPISQALAVPATGQPALLSRQTSGISETTGRRLSPGPRRVVKECPLFDVDRRNPDRPLPVMIRHRGGTGDARSAHAEKLPILE
jgi:hypothetical protein